MPGLTDCGVAVLAVIAYHLKIGWAGAGLLGVGVFFTLSGLSDHRHPARTLVRAPPETQGILAGPGEATYCPRCS